MNRFPAKSMLLALATFGLFGASHAMADTKIFSPLSCRGLTTVMPNITSSGMIINSSLTLPFTVVCPIVRDNTAVKPTSIAVTVVDNSSVVVGDGNFQCRVTATAKNGTSIALGTLMQSTGTNSNGQTLDLPVPAAQTDGPIMVSCKIPRRGAGDPSSLMGSIKVVEPDPGN